MTSARVITYGFALLLARARAADAHPVAVEPPLVPSSQHEDLDRRLFAAETAMPIALVSLGVLDGGHTGRAMVLGGVATSFVTPSPGELRDGRIFSLGMGARALGVSMMAYDATTAVIRCSSAAPRSRSPARITTPRPRPTACGGGAASTARACSSRRLPSPSVVASDSGCSAGSDDVACKLPMYA
jgi:hypothetical protein